MVRHLLAPHVPAAARALGIARTIPDPAAVALTFDDGPHPAGTPAILEVLARAGARATFFMVGEQVLRRPALAAEVLEAGHAVALHGFTHLPQPRLSAAAVREDLLRGAAAIAQATGAEPLWHRPPYGVYSASGLRVARELGMRPLLWSRWGRDWRKFTTPRRIARRAARGLTPGDVILLHDADFYSSRGSHERTVRALPLLLAVLDERGIGTVLTA